MKIGKKSLTFDNIYIHKSAVVVGPTEEAGPLKGCFDYSYTDLHCEQKSWEKAEMMLYRNAFNICLNKNNIDIADIDCIISGDLNDQLITGNYVMRDYDLSYLGIFSACSSSVEGLIIGGNIIEAKNANKIIVATSSHYGTSERHYRYPTEYGGQKPETQTTTVSVGASTLLSNSPSKIKITKATIGRIFDAKINDPSDMGRAMAPAAFDTILQHFKDFNVDENSYDLIITGDLSHFGSDMLVKLFKEYAIDISNIHKDTGLMIYNREKQEVFSGGSGCGCLPAVLYTHFEKQLMDKNLRKILVVATGALLNPVILAQKETIPAIAHAVVIERV